MKPKPLSYFIERFWTRVTKSGPDDCWLWNGPKNNCGYGRMPFVNRTHVSAHRLSLSLVQPAPNSEAQCLHSCDNPSCVNPKHLRWGTSSENMADRAERTVPDAPFLTVLYEYSQAARKLKDSQVAYIKLMLMANKFTIKDVAKCYCVGHTTIEDIKYGKRYNHIDPAPLRKCSLAKPSVFGQPPSRELTSEE